MSMIPIFGGSSWMGICYGPYHQAASMPFGNYTKANVAADMAIIKQHYSFIRTYALSFANQWVAECAHNAGLQMAMGTWIYPNDSAKTNTEIDLALQQANQFPDTVKVIVIGNEVDLPSNNLTVQNVKDAYNYAVQKRASYPNLANLPLSICTMGTGPIEDGWNQLMPLIVNANSAGNRHIFLTIYPYYDPARPGPGNINAQMQWSHDNGIVQAENAGLNVVIGEIGWPSAGDADRATWPNEAINYGVTCSYIKGGNQYGKSWLTFWFEMFDEPWKTAEGAWGPYFGLYGSGVNPTPKSGGSPLPSCK